MKNPKKVKAGKLSRVQGKAFENRVRADLEKQGFIVDRWTNQVDLENNKLIPSKPKMRFNPISKSMSVVKMADGFPDFIAFIALENRNGLAWKVERNYSVPFDYLTTDIIGVESKMTGKLDKLEKEKCSWLLSNHVFSKILIAKKEKIKNKIHIVYEDFTTKCRITSSEEKK